MITLCLPVTYRNQSVPRNLYVIWVNILGVIKIVVTIFKHMSFEICKLLGSTLNTVDQCVVAGSITTSHFDQLEY